MRESNWLIGSLCDELGLVEAKTGGIRQLVEHGMASRLLCLFFGWDWHQQKVAFSFTPDDWMLNGNDDWLRANAISPDVRRLVNNHRVIRLADALFTLLTGHAKGLEALKRRFLERATKPCFIEAEIASLLVYNGCEVEIVQERGVRGEDFDLQVCKDGLRVSVEVTSKASGPLTVQTVKNTLHSKRNQVPPDYPAVLYLHVPAEWMRDETASMAILSEAIDAFAHKSSRFNAFVFVWEEVIAFMNGGWPRMTMRLCNHNRPRHPFERVDLFTPRPDENGESKVAHSFLARLEAKRTKLRTS